MRATLAIGVAAISATASAQGAPSILWQFGALQAVPSAVYSPDGQTIACGGWDETIKIFRASDGKLQKTLTGHTYLVSEVRFSPNGQTLASSGRDFNLKLWRTSDWQLLQTIPHPYHLSSVGWSPDGTRFATACLDHSVRVFRASDGFLLQTLNFPVNYPEKVLFSPNGQYLAVSGGDGAQGRIMLWNASTYAFIRTITPNSNYMRQIAFSPDSQTIAGANGYTNIVQLWTASTGALAGTLTGHTGPVWSVQWSPDGNTLATGTGNGDNMVKLWSMPSGTLLRTLPVHPYWVMSLNFTPDSQSLIAGSYDARIWQVSDGTLLNTLGARDEDMPCVAFLPNGSALATTISSSNSRVSVYDAANGSFTRDLPGFRDSVVFSPDSQYYISTTSPPNVEVRRFSDGTVFQTLTGHTENVYAATFSKDGAGVVTGGGYYQNLKGFETIRDCTVRSWNLSTGAQIRVFTGHNRIVKSVDISPDGQLIASCGDDAVKLWNASTGQLVQSVPGVYSIVRFSSDGLLVAAARGSSIDVFNGTTLAFARTLSGFSGTVYAMSFAPFGNVIAAGDFDYDFLPTLRFWRVTDGALLRYFETEVGTGIYGIDFSRDGSFFAYSRWDKTLVMAGNPFAPSTFGPTSFSIGPGSVLSGSLADMLVSDDSRLTARPTAVLTSSTPPVRLVLESTCPLSSVGEVRFSVESRASTANMRQDIEMYDFVAGSYVMVDTHNIGTSDSTVWKAPAIPQRFVQAGTRKVRTRISWKATGALISFPWTAAVDYASWTVTP